MSIFSKSQRRAFDRSTRPKAKSRSKRHAALGTPVLDHLPLAPLHPGQQRVRDEARRFNVCALGRRFGKTEMAKRLLCETAYVEGGRAAYCAPTNKVLNEFWEELKGMLYKVILKKNEANKRLHLVTGGIIECWSLEYPDRPRGRRYHRLIIDEAAQVRHLGYAWQQVLRATLIDYLGDAWFLSTPHGRNYFWQLFRKGDPDNPLRDEHWQSWQLPSHGNPHIPAVELDAITAELAERTVQEEIFAQFMEDSGAVFRRVREAATAEWQDQAVEGHNYVFGIDLARTIDWTVITVLDATTRETVYIDRFRQLDYHVQRSRIIAAYERFKPEQMIIEANSMGWPNIDELSVAGYPVIPFNTTSRTKHAIIDQLRHAFELGQIAILPDEGLIDEILAFESERLPSGLIRYSAPSGQHDDQVMSLALAWAGLSAYAGIQGAGIATSLPPPPEPHVNY